MEEQAGSHDNALTHVLATRPDGFHEISNDILSGRLISAGVSDTDAFLEAFGSLLSHLLAASFQI
jgi:hypothetical protein